MSQQVKLVIEEQLLKASRNFLEDNAFERQNKAEGLGMVTEEGTRKQNETDSNNT